jgi:hypothetical protein
MRRSPVEPLVTSEEQNMNTTPLSRREALAGVGAATVTMALAGSLGRPVIAGAATEPGLGAFLVTVVSDTAGQPMLHAVLALAGGGVAVAASDAPRGLHLGSWQSAGGNALQVRLLAYQFDSTGNNTGYLQVDAQGQRAADSISTRYTVTFVPVSGSSQVVDQGSLSGVRLAA